VAFEAAQIVDVTATVCFMHFCVTVE